VIRWWPDRVPLRLRVFFRGAFLLLALATVTLALTELREEKQQSYLNYRAIFDKNVEQIMARLRHPSGQLALLNPTLPGAASTPLHPLLLPFSAIDFDDKAKAQQAVEMAGCLVQYPEHAQLCVSVGNNPAAGGFIYAVGSFASGDLVSHTTGDRDLGHAHRLVVDVSMRGRSYEWIAPLEPDNSRASNGFRGRLTGFAADGTGNIAGRPDKEFRGWLWQDGRCLEQTATPPESDCLKRSYFSVRLPIGLFREELIDSTKIVWPPKDLAAIQVRVQAFPPDDQRPIFDSNRPGASGPFALADLSTQLLAGETLRIRKIGDSGAGDIAIRGLTDESAAQPPRLLRQVVQGLSVGGDDEPLSARRTVATPVGDFEIELTGDFRGVDRSIALVASRLSVFVIAILAAILLTWAAIELRIIRRITLLTKRAASVQRAVAGAEGPQLDLQGLRGSDELGLLADVLSELLQRINEDAKRERIRVEQEKDMWHAIGHEIMAPLQSLAALHGTPADPSQHYIQRMRQAVRVLYGSASPSEAILSAALQLKTLDLQAFLRTVADNAVHAGIESVEFDGVQGPLIVKADEYPLEDVMTHILSNADRYRRRGTAIRLTLRRVGDTAEVRIHNVGPPIEAELFGKIFEYGVSDEHASETQGHRGQGLFVARTYMAKMGGTIEAANYIGDGVEFVLTLTVA
jgi:signal transduction histidine kinase